MRNVSITVRGDAGASLWCVDRRYNDPSGTVSRARCDNHLGNAGGHPSRNVDLDLKNTGDVLHLRVVAANRHPDIEHERGQRKTDQIAVFGKRAGKTFTGSRKNDDIVGLCRVVFAVKETVLVESSRLYLTVRVSHRGPVSRVRSRLSPQHCCRSTCSSRTGTVIGENGLLVGRIVFVFEYAGLGLD